MDIEKIREGTIEIDKSRFSPILYIRAMGEKAGMWMWWRHSYRIDTSTGLWTGLIWKETGLPGQEKQVGKSIEKKGTIETLPNWIKEHLN